MADMKNSAERAMEIACAEIARQAESDVERIKAQAEKAISDIRAVRDTLATLPPNSGDLLARATVALTKDFTIQGNGIDGDGAGHVLRVASFHTHSGVCLTLLDDYPQPPLSQQVRIRSGVRYRAMLFILPVED